VAEAGFSALIRLLTGRSYPNVTLGEVKYLAQKGGFEWFRGFAWSLFHLRSPRGLMLGSGIKFILADRLRLGRGVSLGRGCYLDCSAERGVTLGNRVTIREYGWLQCRSGLNDKAGEVRIGERVYIGPFAVIGAGGDVIIGPGCQIGARFTLSAESHQPGEDGSYVKGRVQRKGISIGRDCWIGNNVCILDGVRVGDRCTLGAGSVVTRNVPDGATAYGVPARSVIQGGTKDEIRSGVNDKDIDE